MQYKVYGLANQNDYLLFRAGQEQIVRRSGQTGVQDGGLDPETCKQKILAHL